jgi:hypothetical protein
MFSFILLYWYEWCYFICCICSDGINFVQTALTIFVVRYSVIQIIILICMMLFYGWFCLEGMYFVRSALTVFFFEDGFQRTHDSVERRSGLIRECCTCVVWLSWAAIRPHSHIVSNVFFLSNALRGMLFGYQNWNNMWSTIIYRRTWQLYRLHNILLQAW